MPADREPTTAAASRCSLRKHVIENGKTFCDCETVMAGPTANKNALVVTLLAVTSNERARHNEKAGNRGA